MVGYIISPLVVTPDFILLTGYTDAVTLTISLIFINKLLAENNEPIKSQPIKEVEKVVF